MHGVWFYLPWIAGIVAANVLFYVRKAILSKHGYRFNIFDLEFRDYGNLKAVISKEADETTRRRYSLVNNGIRVLVVGSIVVFVLSVVISD